MTPFPPGAPQALLDLQEIAREVEQPTKPAKVFACLEAELPPADKHRHCFAILSDTRVLAISTYTGSAWEWTNADGGAL